MNGPNTHSAIGFINGSPVFIDGIPDECDHDWTGDCVFVSASGKVIYWHTYRQWASFTEPIRNQFIHDHHEQIGDPIVQGGVSCRKCKKPYQPQMF